MEENETSTTSRSTNVKMRSALNSEMDPLHGK